MYKNIKKYYNEDNSYSADEVVAYWSQYGCQDCWLYLTVNSRGEDLLVLLDEDNGVYEELASRLDATLNSAWSLQHSGTALMFSSLPAGAVPIDLSIPSMAAFSMDLL